MAAFFVPRLQASFVPHFQLPNARIVGKLAGIKLGILRKRKQQGCPAGHDIIWGLRYDCPSLEYIGPILAWHMI